MEVTKFQRKLFFLLLCFITYTVVKSDETPKPKNMLDAIQVCPSVQFLKDSYYLSKCSSIPYTEKVDLDNINLAMCMTACDITYKICQYLSTPIPDEGDTLKLPKTAVEFDEHLHKFQPKSNESKDFITDLCKNMPSIFKKLNNSGFQSNTNLLPYVKYVNEILLKDSEECSYTCRKPKGLINPFCIFFLWVGDVFGAMTPLKTLPSHGADVKDITKNTEPAVDSPTKSKVEQIVNIGDTQNLKDNKKQSHSNDADQAGSVNANPVKIDTANKASEANTKQQDTSSARNENVSIKKTKPSEDKKQEHDKNENKAILPPPNENNLNPSNPKPADNVVENIANVEQQEEANNDDFISNEDGQNKKGQDNEPNDVNEQENDDIKDPLNIPDEGRFEQVNNPIAEQHESSKDEKKVFPHSPISKEEEEESHFFTYFSVLTLVCLGLYIANHNKQKILAMVLEGRRGSRRGSRGNRRRPSTASYRKLDSNLEEAVTSQCNANVTHVIY